MTTAMDDTAVVIMGPCGVGKTTVAGTVARRVGGTLVEADDYHTAEAMASMAGGDPLTDDVRMPWLDRVAAAVRDAARPTLIACSALKRAYRDRLRGQLDTPAFVHLTAPRDLIASRLAARQDHFVGVDLLDSQLATLEPLDLDETGIIIDVSAPLDSVCEQVLDFMAAHAAANLKPDSASARSDAVPQHMQGR